MSDDLKELIDWLNDNHIEHFNILYSKNSLEDIKDCINSLVDDKERLEEECDQLNLSNMSQEHEIYNLEEEVSRLEDEIFELEGEISFLKD